MTDKPLSLDALADITDPADRAREAARLDAYATATAGQARAIRDDAIRAAYASGGHTRAGLAAMVGVTESLVVTALRSRAT